MRLRFRWFLGLLLVSTSLISLLISGTAIFEIRREAVTRRLLTGIRQTAHVTATRTEGLLSTVESALITLAESSLVLDPEVLAGVLERTMPALPMIRTIYFINGDHRTFAVGTHGAFDARNSDYIGIDFAFNPLYRTLEPVGDPVWSDKFVSTLAGDTIIGAGIRRSDRAAIAEVSLESVTEIVDTAASKGERIWVIDSRGELVADSLESGQPGIINVGGIPYIRDAFDGRELSDTMIQDGVRVHPAIAYSKKLGWYFLATVPAGLANPEIFSTVTFIALLFATFLVASIVSAVLWTNPVAVTVGDMHKLIDRISEGSLELRWRESIIGEFNDVAAYMVKMSGRIRERELSLKVLNEELEDRVRERTRELRVSLENLKRTQEALLQSEKLAYMGRLVAGVAHAMNTPIGNTIMAVSKMRDDMELQTGQNADPAALNNYFISTDGILQLAETSLKQAADLVRVFRDLAADQNSSTRRRFRLSEVLRVTELEKGDSADTAGFRLEVADTHDIILDSYPGTLNMIIGKLVDNALIHAWKPGENGTIKIFSGLRQVNADVRAARAVIIVSDDGRGIDKAAAGKIFDPFYTTNHSAGCLGLGLNVAYNAARNILGGNLSYRPGPDRGSEFRIDIPMSAPEI